MRIREILRSSDELIVVDEGSVDRSRAIGRELADTFIQMPEPKTIAYARNLGCFKARGDIIVSMDPDVIVPLNTIEVLEEAFSDERVVACGADCYVWREIETLEDRVWHVLMNFRMRFSTRLGFPASKGEFQAFRREAFHKVRGYDVSLPSNEDVNLMHRMGLLGKVIFLPKNFHVEESPMRYRAYGYFRSYASWTVNWVKHIMGFKLPPYKRISH
jgi:glycosyltransferase involved in cell wall biosynthesis